MAKKAAALIVAGSGTVTEDEVNDLILDRWPDKDWDLDLMVPVNKDLFSEAVETVVDWFNDDEHVYPVREVKGSNLSRRSAKLGAEYVTTEVDNFAQVFNPTDFADWDEVHLLIAMSEDAESPEYDVDAEIVAAAIDAGFSVMNLSRGLDDVRLEPEADEPDPEPEEVEEKPKRRSRAKKTEEEAPVEEDSEVTKKVKEMQKAAPVEPDARLSEVFDALQDATRYLRGTDEALQVYQQLDEPDYRPLTLKVSNALETLRGVLSGPTGDAEPTEVEEPEEKKSTGRGRPRTNFILNQIWDEESDSWIARPKGRLAKGTEWRKYNEKTGETVEEGTA